MPMLRYEGGYIPSDLVYSTHAGTQYIRLRSANWVPTVNPIVMLHGWPQAETARNTLLSNLPVPNTVGLPFNALLATGRSIYMPFTGSNFGHGAVSYPSVGGTGTQAITDMIEQSEEDGSIFTQIDLIGLSMGGTNAINWALRNPDLVNKIWLGMPGIDFGSLYDVGSTLQTTLVSIFGGVNREEFLINTTMYDPIRLDLTEIANKISVNASNPDVLIDYSGVVDWTTNWNIPLNTTTSNHFSLDDNAFDELMVLRWLDS